MLLRNGTVKIQQLMTLSIQDLQFSKLKYSSRTMIYAILNG